MASQQDLQELLRLLKSRHGNMLAAMGQAKALQAAVRLEAMALTMAFSIAQIADAPLDVITKALGDAKAAKSLRAACTSHGKMPTNIGSKSNKRTADDLANTLAPKRPKTARDPFALAETQTPQEVQIEAALDLPYVLDEELIAATRLYTNRAPVLLAFAFELLRFTMPEQPVSSRLSLAQAVVSMNSQSKAVSLGLQKEPTSSYELWGLGQPKVRVMGREVTVLKRGRAEGLDDEGAEMTAARNEGPGQSSNDPKSEKISPAWGVSRVLSSRDSTFVARAIVVADASHGRRLVNDLIASEPGLDSATHNSWGLRTRKPGQSANAAAFVELSDDDGEDGCGQFIIRLLREAQATETLVVVSRWFGGTMLGPDRWRLIRSVVNDSLSERLRQPGQVQEREKVALWGLNLQNTGFDTAASGGSATCGRDWWHPVPGAAIHRPEPARNYLLKSFHTHSEDMLSSLPGSSASTSTKKGKKAGAATAVELEENLARLLGALRLLFDSWAGHLTTDQLDQKAWAWYVQVRPGVESGPKGWGAKGWLDLRGILSLNRKGETLSG